MTTSTAHIDNWDFKRLSTAALTGWKFNDWNDISEATDYIMLCSNEHHKKRDPTWSHARAAIQAYQANVRNGSLLDTLAVY